jgi:hypothetical protein
MSVWSGDVHYRYFTVVLPIGKQIITVTNVWQLNSDVAIVVIVVAADSKTTMAAMSYSFQSSLIGNFTKDNSVAIGLANSRENFAQNSFDPVLSFLCKCVLISGQPTVCAMQCNTGPSVVWHH